MPDSTVDIYACFYFKDDKIQIKACASMKPRGLQVFSTLKGNAEEVKMVLTGGHLIGEVTANKPGTSLIYATLGGSSNTGSTFFKTNINVIPKYGHKNDIDIKSIAMQTHLMRCMGNFTRWEDSYDAAKLAGFNVVHLTPVNKLSEHGSAYAVASFTELEPRIFGTKTGWADLKKFVERMNREKSIMTICDVVPNHCSYDNELLKSHPDIIVNLKNHSNLRYF